MARLKLISKPIPWFLAVKAVLFAAAWFFLPYWFFILCAAFLYFKPWFRSPALLWPFLLVLFFSYIVPVNFFSAAFLGIIFFLILGIKELFFIERFAAYELLIFLFFFLGFLNFFSRFENWQSIVSLFWSCIFGLIFLKLFRDMMLYLPSQVEASRLRVTSLVVAFLLWEFMWFALFLPFTFFHQTALLLLITVTLVELGILHITRELNREKIMGRCVAFAILAFVILITVHWGL